MDQVREVLRDHYYSIRTEEAYVCWVFQFIRVNDNDQKNLTKMGFSAVGSLFSDSLLGFPPSTIVTSKLVVPMSMPTIISVIFFPYKAIYQLIKVDFIESI